MKKILFFTIFFTQIILSSFSCTNLLVGKSASKDGSVMITYSADSYDLYGELYHWSAKKYPLGEMLKIYDWDSGHYQGEIKQTHQTYNVVGNMNEYQLTIAESTFGGRPELVDPKGIIDYGSLIYITLQRAKNAREAITIIEELVNEYGYASSGESFSIGDPNELWVMELIGKGDGNKGAVWVAVRIPDDCITAHANQSRIQQFKLNDPNNCLYSKDVISFARDRGYYKGDDADFSFAQAYNPIDFGGKRFCDARVWSFFNRFNKTIGQRYLAYAMGESNEPMPLYIKPDEKISVEELQSAMRDHYEDTPLDSRYQTGAGGFESPYRWAPLEWEVDAVKYFNERPISTQQTAFTFVAQMRSWLPDAIGGLLWFGVDDAAQTVYTPIYCSITEVPQCYATGNGDLYNFSWTSAFWIHNWVSNMVYNKYNYMYPDLQKVQRKLETKFFRQRPQVEAKALDLYKISPKEAIDFLTLYSDREAQHAFEKWKKLGEFMTIKYMDGIVRKEKNGKFLKDGTGTQRVGYSKEYYIEISKNTGNHYKIKN